MRFFWCSCPCHLILTLKKRRTSWKLQNSVSLFINKKPNATLSTKTFFKHFNSRVLPDGLLLLLARIFGTHRQDEVAGFDPPVNSQHDEPVVLAQLAEHLVVGLAYVQVVYFVLFEKG